MIPLVLLWACAPATTERTEVVPGARGLPTPVLSLPDGRVLDPTLAGDPTLSLSATVPTRADGASCSVELELVGAEGGLASWAGDLPSADDRLDARWDGRTDDGARFPAGLATLFAWSQCDDGSRGSASVVLASVRLLPQTIDVGAADPADEVLLAFHKSDLRTVDPQTVTGPEYRRTGASSPAPWSDPDQPPWSVGVDPLTVERNVPAGLVMGATPVLTVTVDDAAVPGAVEVRFADEPWQDGVARALDPLAGTAGREVVDVDWTWTACLEGDCAAVPGSATTSHELYRLLAPSELRDGSADGYADGTPWIGVLADTADAVEGAADGFDVLDGLRDRVYEDPWLLYDPSDRSYSEYDGAYIYWESITSELSLWLDRQDGLSLYCHSVSCLLSTLGQTWGVDAEQIVLGVGFQTNLAQAAGSSSPGRWYFNSHSVVTLDDGGHVWDASIDVDGDDDPYNAPFDAVSPLGMPGDEYFWRLTYDDIDIVNQGKCLVR
ncbi:MAG: hypothetical protein H6742_13750 [Alphaproteobacteria bacterium]|nr:hypothetical protein [Alphaproteobacteria bacterium]